ncbi:tRNA pseudouridine(38-40) synthase TruA [Alkalicoccobacillus porphyridii]|uniref:tRNA pseudouridine synthase A n=1 Tax=Alkalicoccobacillus porphyridii TaxID=2597270 RepID=A0A553ZU40_9BACI|nr:tRNA pseudouridine(38-40) synthase TruA [Alkalicoccobacillus porphyridii]TSB44845.1 tRNA pseudouridine(38-40) synthase TruA [Alkalicoccobacillus porphyridii]
MQRVACRIEYIGTGFSGYQVQPNGRTVQEELEAALKKLHKGQPVHVSASGRTDAGVHAKGQVIHFDSPLTIPSLRWSKAVNPLLPADIRVSASQHVATNFHARYSAVGKQYRYKVTKREDIFLRNRASFVPTSLNVTHMRAAAEHILGTHDFSSFCAANTSVVDKVRTVTQCDIVEDDEELTFILAGNGFLYNMVRIAVGTLLEIGAGKRAPEDMQHIIAAEDRGAAGKTAPAHGLYLWSVGYAQPMFTSAEKR